jgi:ABC-type glutathione transport system ATPase component
MTTNLSVHNLSKSFKNRNHSLQVLRDINFEVQEGEILSIV